MTTLDTLLETPTGRRMVAELKAEAAERTLEERSGLARELKTLRTGPTKEIEKAEAAVTKAREKVAKLNEQARAAVGELYEAQRSAQALTNTRDRRITEIERRLRNTAPLDVQETKEWARDMWEKTRRYKPELLARGVRTIEGPTRIATHTERLSQNRRMAYLQEIVREGGRADQIALLPDPEAIRRACEEIRENLPPIEMEPIK